MSAPHSAIITPGAWTRELNLGEVFAGRGNRNNAAPNRLEVELGCGKGTFLLARARAHPETDFVGIDRMLKRLRRADSKVVRHGLQNVALLRIEASYAVEYLLPDNSVDAFFVLFPDPWPKKRHHRRRLFQEAFLHSLAKTLKKDGIVHIATDHEDYFSHIRALFAGSTQFEEVPPYEPEPDERTNFEVIFREKGLNINRASYRLVQKNDEHQ